MVKTYDCANQYRCSLAVYLTKIILLPLNISVDREIGASGNGKYFVDGLNIKDKDINGNKQIFHQKYFHNL